MSQFLIFPSCYVFYLHSNTQNYKYPESCLLEAVQIIWSRKSLCENNNLTVIGQDILGQLGVVQFSVGATELGKSPLF